MIGYKLMKQKNLWKFSRDGKNVVYTRKAYSKQTGEEIKSIIKIVDSSSFDRQILEVKNAIAKLELDLLDLEEAVKDIKEQEAIIDPDA
jgi:hypothetical protein|tara:strand:+ start:33 stop:299 length:267 start_codon:yes stop_codon:yes gene_type:complete